MSTVIVLTQDFSGFPGGSEGKESVCKTGDLASIPGLGRSLGGGHGNPLQVFLLENPYGQRSLAGYSPWGRKELDTTERLSTQQIQGYVLIVIGLVLPLLRCLVLLLILLFQPLQLQKKFEDHRKKSCSTTYESLV